MNAVYMDQKKRNVTATYLLKLGFFWGFFLFVVVAVVLFCFKWTAGLQIFVYYIHTKSSGFVLYKNVCKDHKKQIDHKYMKYMGRLTLTTILFPIFNSLFIPSSKWWRGEASSEEKQQLRAITSELRLQLRPVENGLQKIWALPKSKSPLPTK